MLEIKNLKKSFNKGSEFENRIFEDFNLIIENNTSLAIIGSNGCGKSTLLNLIAGSLETDGGSILVDGEEISKISEKNRSSYFGRVHQDPSKGVSPSLTILENMALADNKNKRFGLTRLIQKDRIQHYKKLLSTLNLGLEDMVNRKVSLLSGGQRQSLSLLMASMKSPKLLLLDEHTASLDPKTSMVVMDKTQELIRKKDITTLIITHNMRDAVKYSDRVIMLKEGKVVFDELSKNITETDLDRMYLIGN